ncbi:MAG: VOC family protein [Hyphomicrobiales bacterium]|nr:VOC family protein [Hyphomicrobiales bacterium]MCY4032946.1 VOC family protein [Hyphomicrobiales bacterium]MCY4038034.1 VOC family protein [Hyphomicrobiales bacterium]
MAKIIHTMLRVLDEGRSVDFYRKAFGLEVANRMDFDSFTLVYLRNDENDVELELTINKDQKEPYTHGNAYGHIAVAVDDVAAEHARFEREGLEPRKLIDMKHDGKPLAKLFFITDPDGYEIEVLQKQGRYQ